MAWPCLARFLPRLVYVDVMWPICSHNKLMNGRTSHVRLGSCFGKQKYFPDGVIIIINSLTAN